MKKNYLRNAVAAALLGFYAVPAGFAGDDNAEVKMPLVTYKALLMEHLEREKEREAGPKVEKNEWALDESYFTVLPGKKQITVQCRIDARMLKGKPGEKIKLFNDNLLLTGALKETGCNLVSQDGALYIVPTVSSGEKFSAEFSFAVIPVEGLDSSSCRIPVPYCLKNILDVKAVKGIKLVSADGANIAMSSYAVSSGTNCELRFKAESADVEIERVPDIDIFCNIIPICIQRYNNYIMPFCKNGGWRCITLPKSRWMKSKQP